MHIKPVSFYKLLFTACLFAGSLNATYACLPPEGAKPASIAQKAQDSRYVFDGRVTEVTDTYIKVRVEQYFKGMGLSEVKIAQDKDKLGTCADQLVLDQRALFFAKGTMGRLLEAVYDGTFGSVREMSTDSFSKIAAATECMATYEDGVLSTPCISIKDTDAVYQARLDPIPSTDNLKFVINQAQQVANTGSTAKCVGVYEAGTLSVPCISHNASQKVYRATLDPIESAGNLKFAVRDAQQVTHIVSAVEPEPQPQLTTETFDQGTAGTVPNGWEAGITGSGVADWQLVEDSTAPSTPLVLKQSAFADFPWCVKKDSSLSDGFVETKFKPISGSIDQAAGLVWRWKDADSYYVARANALEDNVAIYYMESGFRFTILYAKLPPSLPIDKDVWQTLKVNFQGNHFIVSYQGKQIIDITDDHISGAGAVGVWTKEDSVTSFDDFSYGSK